jgi:histidyl-tRNA synthetase
MADKANTRPLGGMRDFLPLDVLRRRYIVDIVERVYQGYGFEPLETPTMERLDTLLGKYGEEGDQLIFRVMKRGEKLVRTIRDNPAENALADSGLRYDLTVPLARVAAEYQSQLPRVFKRYQIQPVYRADRPAKGRFREFFQCDLDIVGTDSRLVEVEVLNAAAEVLRSLGFTGPDDFRLRLNHRTVLTGLLQASGVEPQREETALVAIDKLDKIGLEGVQEELTERGISAQAVSSLVSLLDAAPETNPRTVDWLYEKLEDIPEALRGVDELGQIIRYSAEGAAGPYLRLDPYLARGLSYYTGPIFEVEFSGFSGSAGGGGRYDELIGMFCGRRIPACGFSFGLERVLLIMEECGLFPERLSGQPEVLLTLFSEDVIRETLNLARSLRDSGLRVDVYPEPGKYGKQFKYADQRQIQYALLLGPHELEQCTVTVKDLGTGEQTEVRSKDVAAWLKNALLPPD